MAKLTITDGIVLLELSRIERFELGRKYIAFDLRQVLNVEVLKTPKKAELGKKTKLHKISLLRSGEYLNGSKVTVFLGPRRSKCIKVQLLNPYFADLYLTFGDQDELMARLKGQRNRAVHPTE